MRSGNNGQQVPIVTIPKPLPPLTKNSFRWLESISSRASRSFSMRPGLTPTNVHEQRKSRWRRERGRCGVLCV